MRRAETEEEESDKKQVEENNEGEDIEAFKHEDYNQKETEYKQVKEEEKINKKEETPKKNEVEEIIVVVTSGLSFENLPLQHYLALRSCILGCRCFLDHGVLRAALGFCNFSNFRLILLYYFIFLDEWVSPECFLQEPILLYNFLLGL